MENKELAEKLKEIYLKEMPNSYAVVKKGALGEAYALTVYLGKPETWANNIAHNDDLRHTYWIENEAVTCDGISLMVDATQPHLAMGRVKIPFRKKSGKNLMIHMRAHFKKIKEVVHANKDKIYHREALKWLK